MLDDVEVHRYAIIPTHNRHDQLKALVSQLDDGQTIVVIIDNASMPPVDIRELSGYTIIIRDEEQPPNLSRLWNVGFDAVRDIELSDATDSNYDVAVLNDDTVLPPGWYDAVSVALRSSACAIACSELMPGAIGDTTVKLTRDNHLTTRMTPHAFIVRGELDLRADESIKWWWGDTDFDWQARAAGGVMIIPGYVAINSLANTSTFGALGEQAGRDRVTFAEKWGYNPW